MRLDPDVLARLREGGPGWQSRINTVLRKALAHGERDGGSLSSSRYGLSDSRSRPPDTIDGVRYCE